MTTNIPNMQYIDPLILDRQAWVWRHALGLRVRQWVLLYDKSADPEELIMASITLTSVPDYRIIIRSKHGLIAIDDRALDLETAMLAAETYLVFGKGNIW